MSCSCWIASTKPNFTMSGFHLVQCYFASWITLTDFRKKEVIITTVIFFCFRRFSSKVQHWLCCKSAAARERKGHLCHPSTSRNKVLSLFYSSQRIFNTASPCNGTVYAENGKMLPTALSWLVRVVLGEDLHCEIHFPRLTVIQIHWARWNCILSCHLFLSASTN